jgi:hypothetical protein
MLLGEQEDNNHLLPEDSPDAVVVVMTILHHKPSQLPLNMSTSQLFDHATIYNKYDITDIVSRMWIGAR